MISNTMSRKSFNFWCKITKLWLRHQASERFRKWELFSLSSVDWGPFLLGLQAWYLSGIVVGPYLPLVPLLSRSHQCHPTSKLWLPLYWNPEVFERELQQGSWLSGGDDHLLHASLPWLQMELRRWEEPPWNYLFVWKFDQFQRKWAFNPDEYLFFKKRDLEKYGALFVWQLLSHHD